MLLAVRITYSYAEEIYRHPILIGRERKGIIFMTRQRIMTHVHTKTHFSNFRVEETPQWDDQWERE